MNRRRRLAAATESKEVGRLLTEAAAARLARVRRRFPDSVAKRKLRADLEELAESYRRDLAERFDANDMDGARAVMMRVFARAMDMGRGLAGVRGWSPTPEEEASLAGLVNDEVGYLTRFREAVEMSRDRRMSLYSAAVYAAMWRGWVAMLPEEARIFWELGVAEHCKAANGKLSCVDLWAGSPYSKPDRGQNPLPTVPKNGTTSCLANCRCMLRAEAPAFHSTLRAEVAIEVTSVNGRDIDPTSVEGQAAAGLYEFAVIRYAYYRRLARATGQDRHMRAASRWFDELDRTAQTFGHEIRMAATDAELLEPITEALALGYRVVTRERLRTDDLEAIVAIIITAKDLDRGRITAVDASSGTVTLDGERRYALDAGDAILLVLDPAAS